MTVFTEEREKTDNGLSQKIGKKMGTKITLAQLEDVILKSLKKRELLKKKKSAKKKKRLRVTSLRGDA